MTIDLKKTPCPFKKPDNATKARMRRVAIRTLGISGEKPVSMGKAMREEGYSIKSADNPQDVTRSKTWKELMDEYQPVEDAMKDASELQKELRHAYMPTLMQHQFWGGIPDEEIREIFDDTPGCKLVSIRIVFPAYEPVEKKDKKGNVIKPEDPPKKKEAPFKIAYYKSPDNRAREGALDKIYKLRGAYAAEKRDVRTLNLSLAELRELREKGKI